MMRISAFLAFLACGLGSLGCGGGSALTNAAGSGNLRSFRSELKQRLERGDVDADEAREVAHRLTSRQIVKAQGPMGERGMRSIQRCAAAFDQPLQRRSDGDDALAALAVTMRFEAGLAKPLSHASYLVREQAHWRAAAARSLTRPAADDAALARAGQWRRQLMLDPDSRVRRAAFHAAAEAADPADERELLEAARLDPDRDARQAATLALASIVSDSALLGLRDIYARADEADRLTIIEAWARANTQSRPLTSLSGSAQLWRISQSDNGMPGLMASLALLRGVDPQGSSVIQGNAAAAVERAIDNGPERLRRRAIADAPLAWPHLLEAIVDAAADQDDRVAVAALGRMTELEGEERSQALTRLAEFGKGTGLAAEEARTGLADAGDSRVIPLLKVDAEAPAPSDRSRAARGYAAVGDAGRALAMLGDQDPLVRGEAACAILEMR